ncbi:MAG: hypothetical protein HPY44_17095 [Armatimonadetes bacterium]|nr:hypothetical protein [Armatimonadota bacterium]
MRAKRLWFPALVAVLVATLTCTVALANEIQLAGVRLGQHAHNVMQVYGQPDCVILGSTGPGSVGLGAAAAGGGAASGQAGGTTADVLNPAIQQGAEVGAAAGAAAGSEMGFAAALEAGRIGDIGRMTQAGADMGAQIGAQAGATVAAARATGALGGTRGSRRFADDFDLQTWAEPVHTQMTTKEQMWCYWRKGVALAFVLDRDGYVVKIAVSGKKADWIRTAMGEPKRTIKLGDDFQKVVERYGYPESVNNLSGDGFSRDVRLHFGYANNITFTLREMKVVGIEIWETDLRGTAPVRLPASGIGANPTRSGLPATATAPEGFRD